MHHRQPVQMVVIAEEIDRAPISQCRHDQPRHLLQGALVIERGGQDLARLSQKAQMLFAESPLDEIWYARWLPVPHARLRLCVRAHVGKLAIRHDRRKSPSTETQWLCMDIGPFIRSSAQPYSGSRSVPFHTRGGLRGSRVCAS